MHKLALAKERAMPRMLPALTLLVLSLICAAPGAVEGREIYLGPDDDWFSVLHGDALLPGDEVILSAGEYSHRRRLALQHCGTAAQPVVIRAAENARVVFRRPDTRQNTFNLEGVQHLHLVGIEIVGGDSGVRLLPRGKQQCEHVRLERLHIHHNHGAAVTANSPGGRYRALVLRRNHIHHTGGHGEGFYLGANNTPDGKTAGVVFDSLIEGNYIHDLTGPHVSQGDGIEIKDGSHGNIIRDNVIHDTKYPGITVYGTDGKARNRIERNVIWNTADSGIQCAADADVINNLVFARRRYAIYCGAHQSATPGNLSINNNTLIARDGARGLRIQFTAAPAGKVVVANNAIYAPRQLALRLDNPPADVVLAGNLGQGATHGVKDNAGWNDQGDLARDLTKTGLPRGASRLIGAAVPRWLPEHDIVGTMRNGPPVVGAYHVPGEDMPWQITAGFKPLSAAPGE